MVKNLIVCGDSFNALSVDKKYYGTHWSEHLSNMLGLNLINLACSGCSTRMVAFQILESLNYEDSIVIAMPSSTYVRYEILQDSNSCYRDNITLKNFKYSTTPDPDKFIESINVNVYKDDKLSSKFLASKVSWGLMKELDNWSLFYALSKLQRYNKKFLFLDGLYWQQNRPYDLNEFTEVFGEEKIIKNSILSFGKYGLDKTGKDKWFESLDPGYHTMPESQVIIANILRKEIINRNLLNE